MDAEQALKVVLIGAIIFFVVVITIQLARLLNTTNEILKDTKRVSNGVAMFLSDPEKIKQNISDLAIISVEKVIDSQLLRVKMALRGNILDNVLNFVFKK